MADSRFGTELVKGLWKENPVFVAVIGMCPAMAVTNSLLNAIVMSIATGVVLIGSCALVSLLRGIIPKQVRVPVFIIIIATFVTAIDFTLAALLPDAHKQLGAFIALIVVNCLILGRAEAFAYKNAIGLSIADAIGMAIGFAVAMCMVGAVREVLGSGTLLGVPLFGEHFEPWAIMVLPPGGFLSLGVLLMVFAWVHQNRVRRAEAAAAAEAGELAGRIA